MIYTQEDSYDHRLPRPDIVSVKLTAGKPMRSSGHPSVVNPVKVRVAPTREKVADVGSTAPAT
jgi:hypothetical protein